MTAKRAFKAGFRFSDAAAAADVAEVASEDVVVKTVLVDV